MSHTITLTDEQAGGVRAIKEWFKRPLRPFILAGLAGTGKSTCVEYIVDELGLGFSEIAYVAYTGKAALVLRQKGSPATTIHGLIYTPHTDKDDNVYFTRVDTLSEDLQLIIVDESSMVDRTIQSDLESYGIPILYIGDHGQLPPVSKDQTNLMLNPNYRLETIHRQALDNPIIRLADMARRGKSIPYGDYGKVKKIRGSQVNIDMLHDASQILCGKNTTRNVMNRTMRDSYGYTSTYPVPYDKLICLRNNSKNGLINGMLGTCNDYVMVTSKLSFTNDEGVTHGNLNTDPTVFETGMPGTYKKGVEQFDYGYCLTVHKSQGSQFQKVVLFEERLGYDLDLHKRWLYTGLTRAIDELIIIGS